MESSTLPSKYDRRIDQNDISILYNFCFLKKEKKWWNKKVQLTICHVRYMKEKEDYIKTQPVMFSPPPAQNCNFITTFERKNNEILVMKYLARNWLHCSILCKFFLQQINCHNFTTLHFCSWVIFVAENEWPLKCVLTQ